MFERTQGGTGEVAGSCALKDLLKCRCSPIIIGIHPAYTWKPYKPCTRAMPSGRFQVNFEPKEQPRHNSPVYLTATRASLGELDVLLDTFLSTKP